MDLNPGATVPSPTPAESACPCLPPPQTRLRRRGAGAAHSRPPTPRTAHAGGWARPAQWPSGVTRADSARVPSAPRGVRGAPQASPHRCTGFGEGESRLGGNRRAAQPAGLLLRGTRLQTPTWWSPCVCRQFCPGLGQRPPCQAPRASWCFHGWPENRLSYWEAVRMCISCILSFTLETR